MNPLYKKETVWIGLIWLRIGPEAGFCEHTNEHLSSINGREFLE
jgi:hypothetical protein